MKRQILRMVSSTWFILCLGAPGLHGSSQFDAVKLFPQGAGDSGLLAVFVADNVEGELMAAEIHPHLVSATLFRGPALSVRMESEGFYDSGNWSTSPSFPGIDDEHFLGLRLQVNPWYLLTIDAIRVAWQDAGSGESARRMELRWSPDGFEGVLFTDYAIATWPDVNDHEIAVPWTDPLDGVVDFRFYGYGAIDGLGVLGLVNAFLVDGFTDEVALAVFGTLELIPEPSQSVWIACLFAALFLLRQHIRKRK